MTARRTFTRRALIGAGIVTGGTVAVSGAAAWLHFRATDPISTVGDVAFDTPLAIPPLLDPEPGADGHRRYELTLQLRAIEADLDGQELQLRGNDTFDILRVRAGGDLGDSPDLPSVLTDAAAPAVPEGATERDFVLEGHTTINGEKMDMGRIDEVVPAGALEVWNVSSSSNPHTFHIHGATFHVIEVEGETPPPKLRGPKDTVYINDGHAVRLAVQFGAATDPERPYMYHCHLLRHEDNGMMGQFVVVEPGTEGSVSRKLGGTDEHAGH